jgi:hypothetical protein
MSYRLVLISILLLLLLLPQSAGSCYEVACKPTQIKDGYGSSMDRTNSCQGQMYHSLTAGVSLTHCCCCCIIIAGSCGCCDKVACRPTQIQDGYGSSSSCQGQMYEVYHSHTAAAAAAALSLQEAAAVATRWPAGPPKLRMATAAPWTVPTPARARRASLSLLLTPALATTRPMPTATPAGE